MNKKINIIIEHTVFHKMIKYAELAYEEHKSEVSGYCLYNKTKGIYSILPLMSQSVNSTSTDGTFEDSSVLDSQFEDIRVHWHSHPNMKACFSAGDNADIIRMVNAYGWYINIVVNLEGDYSARLDFKSKGSESMPFIDIITVDINLIQTQILLPKEYSQMKKEISTKLKPTYPRDNSYLSENNWQIYSHLDSHQPSTLFPSPFPSPVPSPVNLPVSKKYKKWIPEPPLFPVSDKSNNISEFDKKNEKNEKKESKIRDNNSFSLLSNAEKEKVLKKVNSVSIKSLNTKQQEELIEYYSEIELINRTSSLPLDTSIEDIEDTNDLLY